MIAVSFALVFVLFATFVLGYAVALVRRDPEPEYVPRHAVQPQAQLPEPRSDIDIRTPLRVRSKTGTINSFPALLVRTAA